MTETKEIIEDKKQSGSESPHHHVSTVVVSVAGCAFGVFVLGALFGAAWPAAVASCGISIMGVGVAYVMLHRP